MIKSGRSKATTYGNQGWHHVFFVVDTERSSSQAEEHRTPGGERNGTNRSDGVQHHSFRPRVEVLERRLLLSGLSVTNDTNGADLVANLLGPGVTATNIAVTALTTTGGAKGTPNSTAHPSCSAGTFTGGTGIIGFESGIILSNGGIFNVIGPNQYENVSQNNGLPGDSQLAALAGVPLAQTYDATVLQFDFTTAAFNTISFQYVFASDEYNQFANTGYNDGLRLLSDTARRQPDQYCSCPARPTRCRSTM